jgi:integrase
MAASPGIARCRPNRTARPATDAAASFTRSHRLSLRCTPRPSILQAWIAGLRLAPSSAAQVVGVVSAVLAAAQDDGLITRNPIAAKSVQRPKVTPRKARPWTLAQVEAVATALPARFSVLPYLGAGTGMRQGELFGVAVEDVDFLRKVIHIRVQVRLIGGALNFAPLKNNREHDVPLAESLVPVLAEHMRRYPPCEVTLPWKVPDGEAVTRTLILTTPAGRALNRTDFNRQTWHPALVKAAIRPAPEPGEKRRRPDPGNGMHVLRHTAASSWLSARVNIAAVAAWLGDTVQVVSRTYAHMMPDDIAAGRQAVDAFFTGSAPDVQQAGEL